jgi:hypothetical protein
VIDDNVGVIREITRKESTAAGQFLAFKVGRTLMGRLSHIRLSHIRHKKNKKKDKEESSFSANGFVNGIHNNRDIHICFIAKYVYVSCRNGNTLSF